MNITTATLERAMKDKGHRWFEKGDLNLNIIGIRTPGVEVNKFDDFLTLSCKVEGEWTTQVWPATTDPGLPWLKNPISERKGVAALAPGQYPVYAVSYHRGKYEAVCQRRGPVRVFRDNNRDDVIDFDPESIEEGEFGINIHRADASGTTRWVGKYSAGCQVFASMRDFIVFMKFVRRAKEKWGNTYTYTLLDAGADGRI